jgi:hypothetical protein
MTGGHRCQAPSIPGGQVEVDEEDAASLLAWSKPKRQKQAFHLIGALEVTAAKKNRLQMRLL